MTDITFGLLYPAFHDFSRTDATFGHFSANMSTTVACTLKQDILTALPAPADSHIFATSDFLPHHYIITAFNVEHSNTTTLP